MKWDHDWSQTKKDAFIKAQKDFRRTGTKEAVKDRIRGIKQTIEKAKSVGNEEKVKQYKAYLKEQKENLKKLKE